MLMMLTYLFLPLFDEFLIYIKLVLYSELIGLAPVERLLLLAPVHQPVKHVFPLALNESLEGTIFLQRRHLLIVLHHWISIAVCSIHESLWEIIGCRLF